MMGTAVPEDIRYAVLTGKEHEEGGEEMDHPPYSDATIKRAITQGVDAAGKPLDWTMPRWQMSEGDLKDLLAFLKTLR
jgi:mono/diheme cytochrome c family protein